MPLFANILVERNLSQLFLPIFNLKRRLKATLKLHSNHVYTHTILGELATKLRVTMLGSNLSSMALMTNTSAYSASVATQVNA